MIILSDKKQNVVKNIDKVALKRDVWIKKNKYYYQDLTKFFRYNVPEGSSVLEIGCGNGYILDKLKPSRGVGIDISLNMVERARKNYPHIEFSQMDAENITLCEKFDYIIISDTLCYLEDIQKAFKELWKVVHVDTRIIITYHNFLWLPILYFAEILGLKMPQIRLNWLNSNDIENLLHLEGFDLVKKGRRLLCPKFIPILSWLLNKYIGHLPLLNRLTLIGYIIGRPVRNDSSVHSKPSVSVIIPARNEKGNIENALKRMPNMGRHTEVIFVEGHSTDGTLAEIKRVCWKYSKKWNVKYYIQDGKGKADAVRKGFSKANEDILMILDADLTVRPEDLTKFYDAITSRKGEFINGTRLVYPLEKEAMRTLNILGNKFFSMIFSWLLEQRLKDTLCGTKVISRINYKKLIKNRQYFGEFDPFGDFDLIFGAAKMNLKIIEVPIHYQARKYGETNISRFRHGWLLLKMVFFAMNKIKFI
jgi:SAM-dependent methyltransferase